MRRHQAIKGLRKARRIRRYSKNDPDRKKAYRKAKKIIRGLKEELR